MKSKSIALALVILLSAVLVACGGDSGVTLVTPPSISLSPSDSVLPSGTPTPTIAPSAAATPDFPVDTTIPEEIDTNLGDSFKELEKNSNLVVRGKFVEKLKEPYNQIRDMNDPELPDAKEKILEWQFVFEITDVYKIPKDSTIKKGDKVTVNLVYEENYYMTGYKTKAVASYFEPDLNKDVVLFLAQNSLDEEIFYPDVAPFYFEVKEEKLYGKSNTKKDIENFEKKMKLAAGEGAPIANLKKDLGVK